MMLEALGRDERSQCPTLRVHLEFRVFSINTKFSMAERMREQRSLLWTASACLTAAPTYPKLVKTPASSPGKWYRNHICLTQDKQLLEWSNSKCYSVFWQQICYHAYWVIIAEYVTCVHSIPIRNQIGLFVLYVHIVMTKKPGITSFQSV